MYWIWNPSVRDDEAMIYGVPPALLPLREAGVRLDYGVKIATAMPLVVIKLNEDSQGRLNDNILAPGTTGLLFSSRLRSVLTSAGIDNLEYFPTRIMNPQDAASTDDYWLVNVVGHIAGLDLSRSQVEMDPQDTAVITFIDALVLDESRIRGALFFRLAEFLQIVVVHERVKRVCETAGITGVGFVRPEDYSL